MRRGHYGILRVGLWGFGSVCVLALITSIPLRAQAGAARWIATWSTAEVGRPQVVPPPAQALPPFMPNQCPAAAPAAPFAHLSDQTVRQIAHISIGGSKVRVAVSNYYGTSALRIGAAHVALHGGNGAIQPGTGRPLTFSGKPSIAVPSGAIVYSDPADLRVPDMADIAIDLHVPETTDGPSPLTMHDDAFQTTYVSEPGNHVGKPALPPARTVQNWFLLARVEVESSAAAGAIITFGDSITDGARSTPNTNSRWPDLLARRLIQASRPVAVVNAGIAGNRVLSEGAFWSGINALARFEHHVLSQPGATHVIVLEGINDIGQARTSPTPTAEDIIAGHRQLIAQARAHGLRAYGGTLLPFWGAGYYTDVGEAKREAVNNWIRTGGAYDAVIDFDKVTRDPADPRRLLPAYDSCDHLHPSDAGYKAMAEAVDLALFAARPGVVSQRR